MPPVAAAAAAAVAGGIGISAAGAITFSLSSALLAGASSLVLNVAQRALTPKPKKSAFASSARGSQTINLRQPITTHKLVYGQTRVSGPVVFVGSTQDNLYLHLILVVACHEVQAIDEVWFNETSIPSDALDANGNVTTGRYANKARIRKYLGAGGQSADPLLVAEVPEWTTAHRLSGMAYVYVRLEYNQELYPGGIPNISAFVRGRKVYDTRDGNIKFSLNPALFARDYLTDSVYGFEATGSIDDASVTAAANICDEMVTTASVATVVSSVNTTLNLLTLQGERLQYGIGDRVQLSTTGTLPGGLSTSTDYFVIPYQFKDTPRIALATSLANAVAGLAIDITTAGTGTHTVTKNAEPRYHGAGVADTGRELRENMIDVLSAFGGQAVYAGGLWRIAAGAYVAPTVSFDEDDIIGPVVMQTKLTRRERFNAVRGVYTSYLNDWQPADYPPVKDAAAQVNDGQPINKDIDLPYTFRPYTAQRIAKVELKKALQEIAVKVPLNLKGLQVQAGETIQLTIARFGWTNKVFEVTGFRFTMGGNSDTPELGVELTLRETASAVYDWSSSEESGIDPAPNTSLPDGFTVQAVQGVAFDSIPVETAAADTVFTLALRWTQHPNAFVREGGQFEVQFKLSTEPDWRPSFFVAGNLTNTPLGQGSAGQNYDIRIRALNNFGVPSSWQTLTNLPAGSTGGVNTTEDWGDFASGPATTEDWGDFAGVPATTEDWGSF